jgi:hypothetical protein
MTDVGYKLSDEVLDRSIGDDLLVHRFDNDEVFVLNAHARLIFEAVKAKTSTLGEIRARIAEQGFDAAEDLLAVERAVREMVEQGLALEDAG